MIYYMKSLEIVSLRDHVLHKFKLNDNEGDALL